ncbi:MAG: hypothetical protein ACRDBY_01025 [Cetobacterium sp.]
MKKEIKFILEWNLQKVIFLEDGNLNIIDIDVEEDTFIYRDVEFTIEQDIEKALSRQFCIKFKEVDSF